MTRRTQSKGESLSVSGSIRHGYPHAEEKIFAADGGPPWAVDSAWHHNFIPRRVIRPCRCWAIEDRHFADAEGMLDWYHASEHVWACANELHSDPQKKKEWAQAALSHLWEKGGTGLLNELQATRASPDAVLAAPLQSLVNYIQPRLGLMDYPPHREKGHAIGTGLMEASVKQLVGERLKGCGMHWSEAGATHMTALRAQDLNGHWHEIWKTLALVA